MSTFRIEEAEQENMRRIYAAVNACEGISTEALESGVVKELLEALVAMLNAFDVPGLPYDSIGKIACVQSRAIIAKAKGE